MLDWEVHEEDQPLASDEQDDLFSRGARDWRVVVGLLLLLMMVGILLFRWRVTERTQAMETDLKVFIRYEEQQRIFGLRERVDRLMVPDAPKAWQEAYRSMFVQADEVNPVEVEVEKIELDGTSAYVKVRIDSVPQVRFYQLVEHKWRRAPLPDEYWGQKRELYLARLGITIFYRAYDEVFVQHLSTTLPLFLPQWPLKKDIRRIQIVPQEFAEGLIEVDETDITLNSPHLLTPEHINGEMAVRLQLAHQLLTRATLQREAGLPALPGTHAFLDAIRMTFILRWALPNDVIPRQVWHKRVKNNWVSPFLVQSTTNWNELQPSSVWTPHLRQAGVLLMADKLYDQYGNEGLQYIIQELPNASSWDRVFYPLTDQYTVELEEYIVSNKNEANKSTSNVPQLPLDVTLLEMDLGNNVLNFEIKASTEEEALQTAPPMPLSININDSILNGLQQTVSLGRCAALHKKLTIIEGDWLKVGEVLQARTLLVSRSSPSISLPRDRTLAPTDTFAYLAEQPLKQEDDVQAYRIFALSEEGKVTHLTTLPPLMRLGWRIPSKTSRRARFLLTLTLPECEEAWLFMYDPRRGILSRWFTTFSESLVLQDFVWNPLEGDVLLTRSTAYESETPLSTNGPLPPNDTQQIQAELSRARYPLSWHSNQAVILNDKRGTVKLIDVALGKVAQILPLSSEQAHLFMLSEDEKRLFYAHRSLPAEKQTFHVLDFESGQDKLLFSTSARTWLQPVTGGTSSTHVLLLRAAERTTRPIASELLLVDTSASEPTVVMALLPDETVTSALICEGTHVLMTVYRAGHSEVRLWQPTGETKRFFKTDKSLQLLSCY